jgi:eukaryotic-like serine/threonine-protein kinase
MALSNIEFWKRVIASGLLSLDRCKQLHAAYVGAQEPAPPDDAAALANWLVKSGELSRYQAAELIAGRGGAFVFGDYILCDAIETGRLAPGFRARSTAGRPVLLFFAAQTSAIDEEFDPSDQAQVAMALESPHVSRVERWVDQEPAFIVVEDLQGQTLRALLDSKRPSLEEACRFGFQTALGLMALHGRGVVHGSLSPLNIWVEPSGTAKILQFPFVRDARAARSIGAAGMDYLAPELFNPRLPAGPLTDIYSLGCVLYELIAGQAPFSGGGVQEKLRRHRNEVAPRLDRVREDVPEEVADVVAEMMDKEAILRCESANHVAHRLAGFTSVSSHGPVLPPKEDPNQLPPGYGAWHAPAWQAPPKQASPASEVARQAKVASAIPAAVSARPVRPAKSEDAALGGSKSGIDWQPPARAYSPRSTKKRAGQRAFDTMLVAGGMLAVLALAGVLWVLFAPGEPLPAVDAPPTPAASEPGPPSDDAAHLPGGASAKSASPGGVGISVGDAAATARQTGAIDDDGHTLWIAPTSGPPLSLRYLPSGVQMFLVLRPAELLSAPEGTRLLDALGPGGQWASERLRAILGVELGHIEQLSIALFPNDRGTAEIAFVMRLAETPSRDALIEAWHDPRPTRQGKHEFLQGDDWAYWLPENESGRVVAIARPDAMRDLVNMEGVPLVSGGIERLARQADAARHVNLLFVPRVLLAAGSVLLPVDLEGLRNPLLRTFDERIECVLLSAQLGEQLFLEVRAMASADQRASDLAASLFERVRALAPEVQKHVASLGVQEYGRAVIGRLPRMLEVLAEYSRAGVEDRAAVVRCYLPSSSAHNLLLAARLTLGERPIGEASIAATADQQDGIEDPAAALDKRISISFSKETLERCLQLIGQEIELDVQIRGSELQLLGITKNQSLSLDVSDQPARKVLAEVLALADSAGRLKYVVERTDGGRASVVITTDAAAKSGGAAKAKIAPKKAKESS